MKWVWLLLGILFRKLLGSYAISTADRGGIDLAAAGTLYTNSRSDGNSSKDKALSYKSN